MRPMKSKKAFPAWTGSGQSRRAQPATQSDSRGARPRILPRPQLTAPSSASTRRRGLWPAPGSPLNGTSNTSAVSTARRSPRRDTLIFLPRSDGSRVASTAGNANATGYQGDAGVRHPERLRCGIATPRASTPPAQRTSPAAEAPAMTTHLAIWPFGHGHWLPLPFLGGHSVPPCHQSTPVSGALAGWDLRPIRQRTSAGKTCSSRSPISSRSEFTARACTARPSSWIARVAGGLLHHRKRRQPPGCGHALGEQLGM